MHLLVSGGDPDFETIDYFHAHMCIKQLEMNKALTVCNTKHSVERTIQSCFKEVRNGTVCAGITPLKIIDINM